MVDKKDEKAASAQKPSMNGDPVLVAFGRLPGSRIDQAAWFGAADAQRAKVAAAKEGLSAVDIVHDVDRDFARTLQPGLISDQGRFSLSPVGRDVMIKLEKMKAASSAPGSGSQGSPKPGAPDKPASGVATAPNAPATGTVGEGGTAGAAVQTPPQAASAPQQGAEMTPTSAAKPAINAELWEGLKPGQVVLGVSADDDGEYSGWWEAKIVRVNGDEVVLHWVGMPATEPKVIMERKYIALLHPDYLKEI